MAALFETVDTNELLSTRIKIALEYDEQKFKLNRIKDQNIIKNILDGNAETLNNIEKKSNYYNVFVYIKKIFQKFNQGKKRIFEN